MEPKHCSGQQTHPELAKSMQLANCTKYHTAKPCNSYHRRSFLPNSRPFHCSVLLLNHFKTDSNPKHKPTPQTSAAAHRIVYGNPSQLMSPISSRSFRTPLRILPASWARFAGRASCSRLGPAFMRSTNGMKSM